MDSFSGIFGSRLCFWVFNKFSGFCSRILSQPVGKSRMLQSPCCKYQMTSSSPFPTASQICFFTFLSLKTVTIIFGQVGMCFVMSIYFSPDFQSIAHSSSALGNLQQCLYVFCRAQKVVCIVLVVYGRLYLPRVLCVFRMNFADSSVLIYIYIYFPHFIFSS